MAAYLWHDVIFVLCHTNRNHMSVWNHLLQDFVRRVSSNNKTALGVFRDIVQRLYSDILYYQKLVTELTFCGHFPCRILVKKDEKLRKCLISFTPLGKV